MPRGQYKRTGIKRGPYKTSVKRAKNAYEKWKNFANNNNNSVLPEFQNMSEGMFIYLYKKYKSLKVIKERATNKTRLETARTIKNMTKGYLNKADMIDRSNETTHEWMNRLKTTNITGFNKLQDDIKWVYSQARNEGYTSYEAKSIVSDWFFGS